MKISHLHEADVTPSSGPDNMATGQAPKMGRSNDVLETTTSGSIATGEPSNLGTQRRGQQSIFKGIKTSKKFANSRAAGIYEDEISEEQLQAKKRREDIFKKAKDRGIGKKPVSREIMAKEAFNGEYDDEAGMVDNNLETMRRAVDGIDSVISAGDNLPEWCQEKIAVAKSMLVTVSDYMRSEEEIKEGDYNNYDNNRTGFKKTRPDVTGEDEPKGMFTVMINGKPWKEASSNEAFTMAQRVANKHPDKKVAVKWPTGQLNTVKAQGVAEGSGDDFYAIALQRYPQLKQVNRETVISALNGAYEDYLMHYGYEGIGPDEESSMIDHAVKGLKQGVAEGLDQPASSKKFYTDKKQWQRDVDDVNHSVHNNESEYIGDTGRSTVTIKGREWARWSDAQQKGYIDMGSMSEQGVAEEKQRIDPKCWKGYKKQGTKMKGDTRVNNCVPVKESAILQGMKK